MPKIVVPFHLSHPMSHAPHRTPSTSSSTFFLCSRSPDVAHIQKSDILIQNLSQVASSTRSSTTRPKLRVISKLCPTTSHCCLLLKILLKALLRLKMQTWTTNKFVLCWLHHGTYRSEKQVRNDRKFITLKEKA